MSTQHPDNAHTPFFAKGPALEGDAEVEEAFYAFQQLGCDEQMWDHEGKEVDSFVVSKLLSQHGEFFRKHRLGRDVFLTLRVPNPSRERSMAKGLLEILESVPRSYDMAKQFYRHNDRPPIFEVILPMTTETEELNRIWYYYRDFVSGKAEKPVGLQGMTLNQWIGDFLPREIQVIPLIEDKESMLRADRIVEDYVQGKGLSYQRVFLARSDPAMTYGSTSAVLLLKIALYRLHRLEKKLGIPIYPIVGLGSAPFRGNFKPTRIESRLVGYPSVQTFTIQSAFKFDYPEELVRGAVEKLKATPRTEPRPLVDEERTLVLVEKISRTFARQVAHLAPLINEVARYVPSRRRRRLHVGLFGYARSVSGIHLPRAIGFCAAFYSIGIPPELLGLADLSKEDFRTIVRNYPNYHEDLTDALRYYDPESLSLLPAREASEIKRTIRLLDLNVSPDPIHQALVRAIRKSLKGRLHPRLTDLVAQAARERKFLG